MREIRRGGNIRCDTHISVDDENFPDTFFKDFPVVILSWWIEGYFQMLGEERVIKNSFMDGPFEFTTQRCGHDIWLERYERKLIGNRKLGSTVEIPLQEYHNELSRTAQHLIDMLDNLSVSGGDIDTLKAMTTRISRSSIDGGF